MVNKLKKQFDKNGLNYNLIIRDNQKGVYEQLYTIDDVQVLQGYEVSFYKIYKTLYDGSTADVPYEKLVGDSVFGKDKSRSFYNKEKAINYFKNIV